MRDTGEVVQRALEMEAGSAVALENKAYARTTWNSDKLKKAWEEVAAGHEQALRAQGSAAHSILVLTADVLDDGEAGISTLRTVLESIQRPSGVNYVNQGVVMIVPRRNFQIAGVGEESFNQMIRGLIRNLHP